jgi:hypothetical protein
MIAPRLFLILANAIAVVCVTSCANEVPSKRLSAIDYGPEWPLEGVTSGNVKCVDGSYVVFEAGSVTYAVNGSARSVSRDRGWEKIDKVQIPGKDISPILEAGLSLCESPK